MSLLDASCVSMTLSNKKNSTKTDAVSKFQKTTDAKMKH